MGCIKQMILCAIAVALLFCQAAQAQMIDKSTARTVAENWIKTIIGAKGTWGGSTTARITDVSEFKRGDRVLGYFCEVEPRGHILVSLVEGLAPVKAFSETSALDPTSDEGPADLLKTKMEQTLNIIESRLGPVESITRSDLGKIPELDRFETWEQLEAGPIHTDKKLDSDRSGGDYQEGEILLTSHWHQGEPYYNYCPEPPEGSLCMEPHCKVGCVATAGAMIIRYWSWPLGRDWLNMPDAMNINPTPAEIDAVAQLCSDIGTAIYMDYCDGLCASGADTYEMRPLYLFLGYTSCAGPWYRRDYSFTEWWNRIVGNLNLNRPMQYRILKHSIVCDGWWQLPDPMVHMNYGWDNEYTTWYVLDQLYQPAEEGSTYYEYIMDNIFPYSSLGSSISGMFPYNPSYNPRFVDRDCWADSVDFLAGQLIHFHRRKIMTCRSGWLNFYGQPAGNTRLYTADPGRGIVINSGYILMYPGAQIKFELSRPD